MPGDLDNYFDIFVAEMKKPSSPLPKSQTIAEAQQANPDDPEAADLEEVAEPKVVGHRFSSRDFSSAEREIQKLQSILRNSQPPSLPKAPRRQGKAPAQWLGNMKTCLFLSSMVLLGLGAYKLHGICLQNHCLPSWPQVEASTPAESLPLPPVAAQDAQASYLFRQAVNHATQAAELTQIAQTEADWNQVSEQWMGAIRLMDAVPETSSNYKVAQEKVREYIAYLDYALQKARVAKLAVTQEW